MVHRELALATFSAIGTTVFEDCLQHHPLGMREIINRGVSLASTAATFLDRTLVRVFLSPFGMIFFVLLSMSRSKGARFCSYFFKMRLIIDSFFCSYFFSTILIVLFFICKSFLAMRLAVCEPIRLSTLTNRQSLCTNFFAVSFSILLIIDTFLLRSY